jgi:pterin-4a-carbinolamine dehydratase
VLYGGAQTIFPTPSFEVGVALAQRIAEVTADLGREPDIDVRENSVAVVTAANRRGRLTAADAEVARRVTAAALARAAVVRTSTSPCRMSVRSHASQRHSPPAGASAATAACPTGGASSRPTGT